MELSKTNMSIATLLTLMESQEPEAIQLNHVVIEGNGGGLPLRGALEDLPAFTVQFSGFVDVELFMDTAHQHVVHLCIRQSAMTFEELERNGDVLPDISISCRVLRPSDRARLDAVARGYIDRGKVYDVARGEELLTQYVDKAIFGSQKYGGLVNA